MPNEFVKNISIEDAQLLPGRFRNFGGREEPFNRAGERNFAVRLTQDEADSLSEIGWNVKQLDPLDPDDPVIYFLKARVHFGRKPPKIIMITSRGKTLLNEFTAAAIDMADIERVDLVIRPYSWDVNGKQGIKAYLKSIYVTIEEDDFDRKYSVLPDADGGNVPMPPPWVDEDDDDDE